MAIKSYKPTTPARRNMTVSAFDGIDKKAKPERSRTEVHLSHWFSMKTAKSVTSSLRKV